MTAHPTLLWNQRAHVSVAEDPTWAATCNFTYPSNACEYQITAGNKTYALASEPIWNDVESFEQRREDSEKRKNKSFVSEAVLYKRYSSLYPYNGHFFAISGKDRSLTYKPENKCIFDLFSAYYLFRANPDDTLAFIDNLAQEVCQKWNDKYSSKEVWNKRSPITCYRPITEHDVQGVYSSKLVLTVSNWHFNEKASKTPKDLRCSPKACKVSIKLSSSSFAPRARGRQQSERTYYFDKNGLCMDYWSFRALIEGGIPNCFWQEIEHNYKESTGCSLEINPKELEEGGVKIARKRGSKVLAKSKQKKSITPVPSDSEEGNEEDVAGEGEEVIASSDLDDEEDGERPLKKRLGEKKKPTKKTRSLLKDLMQPPPPPPPAASAENLSASSSSSSGKTGARK